MPTTNAIGEQIIEAVVAGPDGANRLFTITGAADVCIRATRQQRSTETWTFLVGPSLTRLQFHRAIATASVGSQIVSLQTSPREFTVNVHSVEADWDDEDQRGSKCVSKSVTLRMGPQSRLPRFAIGPQFWHRCKQEYPRKVCSRS
jgi:hypothetical protein